MSNGIGIHASKRDRSGDRCWPPPPGNSGMPHVGESNRGALGRGTVDWTEFFGALREVDYRGTITFESFSSEVVHPTLSANLSIWRNLWTDSMELAPAPVRTYYGA
jgi:sugar phosphate isomerase/epimerase